MKAIGSQAAMKQQTRYKFNAGTELEDNFAVNYYETYFRQYDVQIGRFTGVDKLAELAPDVTPYNFGDNDPTYWNDPTGLMADGGPPKKGTSAYDQYMWDHYGIIPTDGEGPGGSTGYNSGGDGGISLFEWYNILDNFGGGGGFGSGETINLGEPQGPGKPKQGFVGPGLVPIITLSTGAKNVITELPKPRGGVWGPILTVLSYTLSLRGDNVSTYDILKRQAVNINSLIAQGRPLPNKIEYDYRGHKNDDEIVFRYLSLAELNSITDGNLKNVDAEGNLVKKYVTPNLYFSSKQAKSLLSLPVAPGYVVWTFKSLIQATLQPQVGWNPVAPANKEIGGGLEGTIFQLFPVMGVFQLK